MATSSLLLNTDEVPVWSLPLWRESLMGLDWVRLRASKVYYGFGIPKGDGSPVVVVPGFLGHDCYMLELHLWLWRIGYRPYMSRIGRNADCPNKLIERLLTTMRRAHHAEGGRPVHVIGHSLGGVLALGAAAMEPELTGKVITLGSPIRGPRVHPIVLRNARLVRNRIRRNNARTQTPGHKDCFTYNCACGFACSVVDHLPEDKPTLAVFSQTDGVVDWHVSVTGDKKRDAEVHSTHCGMAWNPEVYQLIAERLAAKPARKRAKKMA